MCLKISWSIYVIWELLAPGYGLLTMKVFPAKISERAALQNLYDVRE